MPELNGVTIRPASVDASFRRYFRLARGTDTWIAMDAPPPMEDCRPFVQIAGFLRSMALNGPEIIAADLELGFVLMSDLGTRQYLEVLTADPATAERLYEDAIAALLRLQKRGVRFQDRLPPYDEELLRFELSLFHDWLCERHLGIRFGAADEREWRATCDMLVDVALGQPRVFVHRDYHSRNLMLTTTDNPGILDFQDAVEGPLTYDLASLLKDCYVRWPDSQIRRWSMRFYDGLDERVRRKIDRDDFWRIFELTGVQRHLKAAGIFARLLHRDGKPGYLPDVPRTLRYIVDVAPRYPALDYLAALIVDRCLPSLEPPA